MEDIAEPQKKSKPYRKKNIGQFGIKKQDLIRVIGLAETRNMCEETDELERMTQQYSEECPDDYYSWLYDALQTDKEKGLDETDFPLREEAFGHNRRQEVPLKSYFTLLCEALEDFTLRILIVAAIFSIVAQLATASNARERELGWIEGFAILVAVFVCSNVAAGNDYTKAKQFQQLNKVAEDTKKLIVLRKGEKQQIHQDLIYVGDIV